MADCRAVVVTPRFGYALLAAALLSAASVAFVDRPVATFMHEHSGNRALLQAMTTIPEFIGVLSAITILAALAMRALRRPLPGPARVATLAALSVFVAEVLKTILKIACGRSWPETFWNSNPSFLKDGIYGFAPFQGIGPGFGSFPSGHTTAACSALVVLWLLWPRGRPLYALLILSTAVGLVGRNYHYVADVIAGGALGTMIAVATVRIAERRGLAVPAGRRASEAAGPKQSPLPRPEIVRFR